ncbi:uncharacterized protein LOC132702241 [Cylas formicarius]|uniref:uncharacterized protein LOC132702241 n=1 Tax=Cylas formicarius TaxID=197179 RepID=UPI0029585B8D|nr:uncharacterized protein LOC132702241 [Cylas formicarius]
MKIVLLILLSSCALVVNSEYPRFKRRGPQPPPPPPRPPPYTKKWQKPPGQFQRPSNGRGRPPAIPPKIMQQAFKIPPITKPHQHQPFPKHHQKRPAAPAAFWQRPHHFDQINNNNVQFPKQEIVAHLAPHKQEKAPFQSSPAIPVAVDYDYHVQTNNIPTHANPIKQIGEKGPIHTIPAPNLSMADAPKHAYQEIRRPHQQHYGVVHQYQVTEPDEQIAGPQEPVRAYQNQIHFDQMPQETYQYRPQTQAILSTYLQQQPAAVDKSINVRPSYQSFNYDEQAQQQRTKSGAGFVTATYSLGDDRHLVSDDDQDPLTQAQIVQSYFDTGAKTGDGGGDADAKPSASDQERLLASYYASLPNQEAAERLARLQAAGKVNSNLMKVGYQTAENSIDIYVPDDDAQTSRKDVDRDEAATDYEDEVEEGETLQSQEQTAGYGAKL